MKERVIRAQYDEHTITVYQAYNPHIAGAAVKAQTFTSQFKKDRMTWIKPSFLWMMYRCGWGTKENQESILAIKITRSGFEWALANACLSHYNAALGITHDAWKARLDATPVRIQWDPEKDIFLKALPYRSLQVGLSGEAVDQYLAEWIVEIKDITPACQEIHALVQQGKTDAAKALLPEERLYALPEDIAQLVHAETITPK